MQEYGPIREGGWEAVPILRKRGGYDFCTSKYALVAAFSDFASKVNYYGQLSPTCEDKIRNQY